jgi:heme/copper-type cytochrome/quinol oxidase subunit 2
MKSLAWRSLACGLAAAIILCDHTTSWACAQCRPSVKAEVYNQDFAANLLVLLLPVAVLFLIGIAIYFSDSIRARFGKTKGAASWQTSYNAGR